MKADTNHVQIQGLGQTQELLRATQRCSEFRAQSARALGVIGQNPQKELGVREKGSGLVQFAAIVKRHLLHPLLCSIADVRLVFAWLGIDDPGWINTEREHLFNLRFRCAVKSGIESSEQAEHLRVRVTLDSCMPLATHQCDS